MERESKLQFRLGVFGKFVPIIVAVVFLVYAGIHQSNANGYIIAFFMAMIVGAVFTKTRDAYGEACVKGQTTPIFTIITMAIMLAAVCGKMVSGSGLIQTLAYYVIEAKFTGGMFAVCAFVICCILSFSTGTSVGTNMITFPILFPVGVLAGVHPAFMAGALVSGAIFGDNLAPISDTTIASAGTQNAEMGNVVRTRMWYSLPVAGTTILLLLLFAGSKGAGSEVMADVVPDNRSLVMLLVPVSIIILCFRQIHLVVSLSVGALVSIIVGMASGIYKLSDIFTFPGGFKVEGIFVTSINGTVSTIFMLFGIFCVIGIMEEAGVIRLAGEKMSRFAKNVQMTEVTIVGSIAVLSWLTGVVTVAIVSLGEIVAEMGEAAGINKYRRANLMDCGGLALGSIVPWSIHAIIPMQLATANVEGLQLTLIDVVTHNFYALAMLVMLLVMIVTGFGRNMNPDEKKKVYKKGQ